MADSIDLVARATSDLSKAEAAADKARENLHRLEAEIADLQAFLRTLERYSGNGSPAAAATSQKSVRPSASVGSRARELVDVAISAIREAGAPLPIGDLLDAVNAAGFTIGGQDHKSNLAGYLSRDPRVVSRGRTVGWDLADGGEEPASILNHAEEDVAEPVRTEASSTEFDDLLGS